MPHPLDRARMEEIILRSPSQFAAGLRAADAVVLPDGWLPSAHAGGRPAPPFAGPKLADVLVAGMGGSWMAAALVADAGLLRVPLRIHRGYDLPERLMPHSTLVVASSFSGNTEEALSAYDAARRSGCPLIGLAAGGELARRCRQDGVPLALIPADPPTMQPRSATGYGVGIFARLFARLAIATKGAEALVRDVVPALEAFMETARRRGRAAAEAVGPAVPVVYASSPYRNVARIWKIKFNENAKTPAFWNVFPELNHNEMIGWSGRGMAKPCPGARRTAQPDPGIAEPPAPFCCVLLRDPDDDPRILRRMDLTAELLAERGLGSTVVPVEGRNHVEKLFTTLLVGDWASYELALARGVDPTPIAMVEDLKRRLKEDKGQGIKD